MKKIVLLILLLLAGNILYAADDSLKINVRNKWCNHKDSIIVYEGGFNMIQVYGKDIDPKNVRLRSSSGRLKLGDVEVKGDTANAMAMPMETEGSYTLTVTDKKTGRTLREMKVYADKLPEPRAQLGLKVKGGLVDKKAVLDENSVRVYYPNSSYCYPYKVLSYTFRAKKGNTPMQKEVAGHSIPTDVKMLIKDLPTNGVAEFTEIMAVCPECYEKKLRDLKIVIK